MPATVPVDDASRFLKLERFCVFVGHPRSGHSVLGTLLNAHRQALVSHNLDVIAQVREGRTLGDLCQSILERDREFAAAGRRMGRHSYDVPGQALGHVDDLRVIGAKRAGATSRHLAEAPSLLRELPAHVGMPVCVIEHLRNPWDNIASIWQWERTRKGRSLEQVADAYFARADASARGLAAAGDAVTHVPKFHEELVADAATVMKAVLGALALPADADFLAACAEFVHGAPNRTRFQVSWSGGLEARIAERAQRYPRLAHYRFDAD